MLAALVVTLMVMWGAPVAAQPVLAAARISSENVPPEATLILRPDRRIEPLAQRVARVLELRSGRTTVVGGPPPAGMLEAVPAGQVALDGDSSAVRVLLVGPDGRVVTARVTLSAAGRGPDPRAVALVVEALQDDAHQPGGAPQVSDGAFEPEPIAAEVAPSRARETVRLGDLDDTGLRPVPAEDRRLGKIRPLLFVRGFTGVSNSSPGPMAGVGVGIGVCSEGNCAVISAEYPISSPTDESAPDEVRYRYLTFASGFYTRPFDWGPFTPGAGIAFVTRIGSVEGPSTLDTDLGLRAHVEMAWRPFDAVDILAETGLDLALDQARSRNGYAVTYRGDRWTPWLQAAVRFSPELD